MKSIDIRAGKLYAMSNGRIRRVVQVDFGVVRWMPYLGALDSVPMFGPLRECGMKTFCEFATRVVPLTEIAA